jgi:catechol 2,3-dioxygenase-like lactoylglutathione lyase family enzyme
VHRRRPGHRGGVRAALTRLQASALRLLVTGIGPAVAFYRGVLGLPLLAEGPAFALFDGGGIDAEAGDSDEGGRPLADRLTGPSSRAPDAAAEHERLRALGARLHGAPEAQDRGGILVTFEDPSGSELRIAQLPG